MPSGYQLAKIVLAEATLTSGGLRSERSLTYGYEAYADDSQPTSIKFWVAGDCYRVILRVVLWVQDTLH